MSSRLKNVLPLGIFIRRQQVVKLYRQLLKSAGKLTNRTLAVEIKRQIVNDFARNKHITDSLAIRTLVQEGTRNAKQLQDMDITNSGSKSGADSWMNSSDEGDERGRVGTGWPWSKK
jgi:hypothetical protein